MDNKGGLTEVRKGSVSRKHFHILPKNIAPDETRLSPPLELSVSTTPKTYDSVCVVILYFCRIFFTN